MEKWRIFVDVITLLSVIFIVVDYSYPDITEYQKLFIYSFDLFVVIVLVWDFIQRYRKSGMSFSKFTLKHWYEIPSMMPLILFSTLEHEFVIGSALRSFRLLRLFRIIHLFFRTISIFEGSKIMYILIFAFSSIMFGAYAEYVVEFAVPDSKISSFGDALWWALVTVTTVGYGDIYPVTLEGKVIASFLMIIGIMILGLFISTLGSSFVESWIDKKERKNIKTKISTGKDKPITEGNSLPSVEEETKLMVKKRIDVLESLKEEEFKILISMLNTLYYKRENIG